MKRLEIPRHWTFRSRAVAKHFDQHVRESLPWYDLATNAVAHFGRHYIPRGGVVYDIGASTGNIGLALKETLDQRGGEVHHHRGEPRNGGPLPGAAGVGCRRRGELRLPTL